MSTRTRTSFDLFAAAILASAQDDSDRLVELVDRRDAKVDMYALIQRVGREHPEVLDADDPPGAFLAAVALDPISNARYEAISARAERNITFND